MHRTNIIFFILVLALLVSSCVKPFNPKIKTADANKYVVSGQLTNVDGSQTVNVSRTSSINDPKFLPVKGCDVRILDKNKNSFAMTDIGKGEYSTWIDPKFLVPGASFMVKVITPDGDTLVSDFDKMAKAPKVDSVYYIRKDIEGKIPGQLTKGIQFFLNFKGNDSDSRFYRWNIYETWEYHAEYPLEWYYDGTVHHVYPPDYSRKVCWRTLKIPKIFTLSTNNLMKNNYNKFPLQFVDNQTSRLAYGYSMLVEQFALSEAAYNYWDQLRINSSQAGGLYEKQPLAIKGNIRDLSHPDKEVLGFFSVASVTDKRIFVSNVPNLPLQFYTYCNSHSLRMGLKEISPSDYPAYLMGNHKTYFAVQLDGECVNCLLLGGTNIKPNFWPK